MAKYSWDPVAPRDVRRTDPVHPPKPPGRKDRQKWCRGKVGIEHTPEVMIPVNFWGKGSPWAVCGYRDWYPHRWACYHQWVCTSCGKHISRKVTQQECQEALHRENWANDLLRSAAEAESAARPNTHKP